MRTITARNVHQALPEVMHLLHTRGIRQESRNGPVLKVPGPVSICYEKPTERVIFWKDRDANPFFHCLEALWMLAGRNDVAFVAGIVPRMNSYSDNGVSLNGAYGHRWRHHFGYDQLRKIAYALKDDRYDRRQVLGVWDANEDLDSGSRDIPCNTQVYFSRADTGDLDMTVTNRSNDAVWGALGANAVHFSMLQEYLTVAMGCQVGKYWQISNNLHLYLNFHEELMHQLSNKAWPSGQYAKGCPYQSKEVIPTPLIPGGDVDKFDADVAMVLDEPEALGMTDWFVRRVGGPLLRAIQIYKSQGFDRMTRVITAQNILSDMPPQSDWRCAGYEWLERRRRP